MTDILEELAQKIQKSEKKPQRDFVGRLRTEVVPPKPPSRGVIRKSGVGGVQFDFGMLTGNPMADRFTLLLQQHGDPQQMQVARDQGEAFDKALNRFIEVGENRYAREANDVGEQWNKQITGSVDETIKKLHEEGRLVIDNPTSLADPVSGAAYANKSIDVNGERVKAMSETDAAVMEMMKSGQLKDEE